MLLKNKRPKMTDDLLEGMLHIIVPLISFVLVLPIAFIYHLITGASGNESLNLMMPLMLLLPIMFGIISIYSFRTGFLILNKMERSVYKQIKLALKKRKFLINKSGKYDKSVIFDCPKGIISISTDDTSKIMITNPKDNSVIDISGHFINIENFSKKMKSIFRDVKLIEKEDLETKKRESMIDEDSQNSLNEFLNKKEKSCKTLKI